MRENRGPWYLLTGLLIGLAAGLIYAWLVQPVQYADAAPNTLSESARDQYRAMIALAYKADGNLGRARQRLALLNDSNPAQALQTQADRSGDPPTRGRHCPGCPGGGVQPPPNRAVHPHPDRAAPTRPSRARQPGCTAPPRPWTRPRRCARPPCRLPPRPPSPPPSRPRWRPP